MAAKCAMRWLAHKNRMIELSKVLRKNLMIISYEAMYRDPRATVDAITHFLQLQSPLNTPSANQTSLCKWKEQLSVEEIAQIQSVVSMDPQ
jgi:hypothetical protein